MFQAVEIEGEPYWDGGYTGNPAIWPLIYRCGTPDVVLVQTSPLAREGMPRTAMEIQNRMNEISFNSSLMHEMRAISFVQKLIEQRALKDEFVPRYKNMCVHMIGDEERIKELGVASKFNAGIDFLGYLKSLGRECTETWLEQRFDDIGVRSSVDIRSTFL
jgi:NTE family protein